MTAENCDQGRPGVARRAMASLKQRLVSTRPAQRLSDWYDQFWGDQDAEEENRLHIADGDEGFVNWFCLPFVPLSNCWQPRDKRDVTIMFASTCADPNDK